MEFDHVQYIIQRGGSVVLVPYALKVKVATVPGVRSQYPAQWNLRGGDETVLNKLLTK